MYKSIKTLLILSLLILVNGSCKKIFRKDHSLTSEEYRMMGMPDQTKLSSRKDYSKVISVLYKLRSKNPLSYPRKHSKKSGAVFSCLMNKENLSFVNDTTLSLHERALWIQSFSSFQSTEIQIYKDELISEKYYNEELIDLYIYGLLVRNKMFELAGKINNSKSEEDMAIRSGSGMVVNGYLTMVSSLLAEQVKSRIFSTGDLKRLSLEVSNSLMENLKWIESADRQKICGEIKKVIEKSPSGYVKNNYEKVLKVLEN